MLVVSMIRAFQSSVCSLACGLGATLCGLCCFFPAVGPCSSLSCMGHPMWGVVGLLSGAVTWTTVACYSLSLYVRPVLFWGMGRGCWRRIVARIMRCWCRAAQFGGFFLGRSYGEDPHQGTPMGTGYKTPIGLRTGTDDVWIPFTFLIP